jgi:leucyl aminopeptidase
MSVLPFQGDDLLRTNYPAIHTVGRAAARPPVLIDLRWQPPATSLPSGVTAYNLPLLCLVGKGVCFDSGGLDIKSAAGMKFMKKV